MGRPGGGSGGRGVGGPGELSGLRGLMSSALGTEGAQLAGETYRIERLGRREDLGRDSEDGRTEVEGRCTGEKEGHLQPDTQKSTSK